ncbi:MAG: aminoacyl-tRNA hydrolase [Micrococcales bacterium]|nr:aminoacyl-tRNA hydrolase [Micrococcales bacterium]
MASDIRLLVGLGNPGPKYAANRHNIGAMVLDELASRAGTSFTVGPGGRILLAAARLGFLPGGAPGPRVILAKPQSYMNVSGGPVRAAADYYGVEADNVIVVHDDLDLPLGVVRLKKGGGEGGHNGLRDISKALETKDYLRVRCGIGRPPGRMPAADYVLRDFSTFQGPTVDQQIDRAADAVHAIVLEGLEPAQLVFHTPPTEP